MVGRTNQGTGFHVRKAHGFAQLLIFGELVRMHESHDGQMFARRLEILAEREDIGALGNEVAHGSDYFVARFAQAEHHAGLGGNIGGILF